MSHYLVHCKREMISFPVRCPPRNPQLPPPPSPLLHSVNTVFQRNVGLPDLHCSSLGSAWPCCAPTSEVSKQQPPPASHDRASPSRAPSSTLPLSFLLTFSFCLLLFLLFFSVTVTPNNLCPLPISLFFFFIPSCVSSQSHRDPCLSCLT